jgi:hypothetical protein
MAPPQSQAPGLSSAAPLPAPASPPPQRQAQQQPPATKPTQTSAAPGFSF